MEIQTTAKMASLSGTHTPLYYVLWPMFDFVLSGTEVKIILLIFPLTSADVSKTPYSFDWDVVWFDNNNICSFVISAKVAIWQ